MTASTPFKERVGSETSRILLAVNGLLMVCAWCKKVRDEQGGWHRMDRRYVDKHRGRTSHGMCPECAGVLTREVDAAARVKHFERPCI
jgi:hypothetical protein